MMNVRWTLRALVLVGTAVAAALVLSTTARVEAVQDDGFRVDQARGPVDLGITDRALVGAIDIHTHLIPDSPGAGGNNRAIDAFEFAKLAKARGMRGFVMKSQHDHSSAGSAYLVRKYGTPDVEAFGCLTLNLSVGGINVAAVEQFSQINGGWGRIIMMPSRDNERERDAAPDQVARQRPYVLLLPPGSDTVVSVAKNGELLPNVKHLIGVMAKLRTVDTRAPLVLATGHASAEEHVLFAREGRRLGLQVVLTHGSGAPVPQQLEAAKLGAYIEMTISGLVRGGTEAARQAVETIRKVGAESYIISSDCGQMSNPYPTDCMGLAARALRAQGITDKELDLMFKVNPARLLGLPALPTS